MLLIKPSLRAMLDLFDYFSNQARSSEAQTNKSVQKIGPNSNV